VTVTEVHRQGMSGFVEHVLQIRRLVYVYTWVGLSLLTMHVQVCVVVVGFNVSRGLLGLYIFTVDWILRSTNRSGGC